MVGIGLQGSLTGSGRLEVILLGVIVVAAVVLLLARLLRSTDRKRRRARPSTSTRTPPTSGRPVGTPRPAPPSTRRPEHPPHSPWHRRSPHPAEEGRRSDGGPTPRRPRGSTGAPGTSTEPGRAARPCTGCPSAPRSSITFHRCGRRGSTCRRTRAGPPTRRWATPGSRSAVVNPADPVPVVIDAPPFPPTSAPGAATLGGDASRRSRPGPVRPPARRRPATTPRPTPDGLRVRLGRSGPVPATGRRAARRDGGP